LLLDEALKKCKAVACRIELELGARVNPKHNRFSYGKDSDVAMKLSHVVASRIEIAQFDTERYYYS
jgi:hypothetical protein